MGSRGERSLTGLNEIAMGVLGEHGGSLKWWRTGQTVRVMKRRYVSLALIRLDAWSRQTAGGIQQGGGAEPPFGKMVM